VRTQANGERQRLTAARCAERRLQDLGIELPPPPTPLGAYVEAVQTGNLLFLGGMLPAVGHEPKVVGCIGKELDANAGRGAVRVAALNVLSAAKQKLGSLDRVTRVALRLSRNSWRFLRLFRDVFGEGKKSGRMVFGVASSAWYACGGGSHLGS
jgi:enamine deaminase RidA (YjgF/YER057c/UK114 family)